MKNYAKVINILETYKQKTEIFFLFLCTLSIKTLTYPPDVPQMPTYKGRKY